MSPTAPVRVAAVDLGATSGRVMAVGVGPGGLDAHEVHRFPVAPVQVRGTLHWDVPALWQHVLLGLRVAAEQGPVDAVGIDSWGVDYGLLDSDGQLLGNPVCYRDDRTIGVPAQVASLVPTDRHYAATGQAPQRFATCYQLAADRGSARLAAARRLLLLPDLLGFWLTGVQVAEVTNASTTGLLDPGTRRWHEGLVAELGLDRGLLPDLVEPGTVLGGLLPAAAQAAGLTAGTPVVAVGSHDTASAVVGVPALGRDFAYISSGTWSLVGLELDEPVRTEASRLARASNELGVDGTVRYLRNTMGLWLLTECQRQWEREGRAVSLTALLTAAARVPGGDRLIDADDEELLAPGDMPARIAAAVVRAGGPAPTDPAQTVRTVLDSLALAYRRSVRELSALSGRRVDRLHIVGGGSRNALLCRLTAKACDLPVLAGPAEGASVGNALVAARAVGAIDGDLTALRRLVAAAHPVTEHLPRSQSSHPTAELRGAAMHHPHEGEDAR